MECPVCFAVLEDGNSSVTLCNHTLCITCLNTIIQEGNNKCPLCREVIKEYYNKGEKTKIIIRDTSSDNNIQDSETSIRLLNSLRLKYYLLWILLLSGTFSIINERYNNILLNDYLIRQKQTIENITNSYNMCNADLETFGHLVSAYIYNPNSKGLVLCNIPYYFLNKCFDYMNV